MSYIRVFTRTFISRVKTVKSGSSGILGSVGKAALFSGNNLPKHWHKGVIERRRH